jgi:hypothetical protein
MKKTMLLGVALTVMFAIGGRPGHGGYGGRKEVG